METERFVRRPFEVDAVQITPENIENVAKWCGGTIGCQTYIDESGQVSTVHFVEVDVIRPKNKRQTMGFPNDWVLKTNTGFKVYTDRGFKASFEPAVIEVAVGDEAREFYCLPLE